MRKDFILAIFEDDEALVHSAQKVKDKNIPIHDIYTPFPVHGLDEVLGIKRSFLPYITLVAGATGLAFALALQIWTSAIDWPLNVGGKPFNSIPAFIPIAFELTVLFAAHTSVAAFFVINKLFPGKEPLLFDQSQTDYKFVMAIEKDKVDSSMVLDFLKGHGATEVKIENVEIN